MLNKEQYMRTSAEVCTQIASYFDVVDICVALSDINKAYALNPQTSYSPSPPIKSGSYTPCIISFNTHNSADIYNGLIRADIKIFGMILMEGDVVFFANLDNTVETITETIRLKIDLRRFLPLSNIKYLSAFAGKIELHLYFSTASMVYCPVGFERRLVCNPSVMKDFDVDEIINEFLPIGE